MQSEFHNKQNDQIMDYLSSMVFSFDLTGKILYANPSFAQTLGYTKSELDNLELWDLLSSDGKLVWTEKLDLIRAGKIVRNKDITYRTKDGKPIIMSGIAHGLKDKKNQVFGVTIFPEVKAVIDEQIEFNVSELQISKETTHRPMMSGNLFAILEDPNSVANRILDAISDFVFFKDINGIYRGCNDAFADLLGLDRDQVIGKIDEEIHSKKIAKHFREMDDKILHDSIPRKTEEWVTDGEGKKSYVETIKSLYLNDQDEAMGFLGIGRDFTDRKNNEKQLAENQLWQDIYFNQSTSAKLFMMLSNPIKLPKGENLSTNEVEKITSNLKIKHVNLAMLNLYGLKDRDFLGKNPSQLPFIKSEKILDEMPILLRDGQHTYLSKLQNARGSEIWVRGMYTCLYNEEGLLFGIYVNQKDTTKEIRLDKESKEKETYLRAIIDTTRDGYYAVDMAFHFIDVNDAYCEMSGYTRDELLKMTLLDVMPPDKKENFLRQSDKIINKGSDLFESCFIRKDGTRFDAEVSVSTVGKPDNFFITFVRDITERKQLESFYLIEKELFKNTLLSAAHGMMSTGPDGNVLIVNSVAEKLTGWTQDQAKGKPLSQVMTIVDRSGNELKNIVSQALETGETLVLSDDYQLINHLGEKFYVELSAAPIAGEKNSKRGVVVTLKDTTKRREVLKNYEDLSYRDSLTGLYNRRYLDECFKKLATEAELPITIMVVDVNSLKLTNDAFGHALGDKLLKTVAEICKQVTRLGDVVCRSGGDEFVIILPNSDRLQAKAVMERIISKVNRTYVSSISVSLAIGFATMKSKNESLEKVYAKADHSMYQNKLKYGKEMKRKAIEKLMQKLNHKSEGLLTHNQNVSLYSYQFGKVLNMDEEKCDELREAGLLHDIGKVMLTPQALKKSEIISKDFKANAAMKHVEVGYQLLKEVDNYAHLAEAVLYHHECYDGSGYPTGLKGEEIPIESRILSITNFYEIMTGKRSYRDSLDKDQAIKELRSRMGTQFDPELVEIFIENIVLHDNLPDLAN